MRKTRARLNCRERDNIECDSKGARFAEEAGKNDGENRKKLLRSLVGRAISGARNFALFRGLETALAFAGDFRQYMKHSATIRPRSARAAEARLIRLYHAMEVSLSYPVQEGRRGVGAAYRLMDEIEAFVARFGVSLYAKRALAAVEKFVERLKKRDIQEPALEERVARLAEQIGLDETIRSQVGVTAYAALELATQARGNFHSLAESRHSVRQYRQDPVPDELV